MSFKNQASILAIGTELTTGQIVNQNAAWLSHHLVQLGFEVVLHLTVADDRVRMREALEHCAQKSYIIFVTGGLGPTTDDFTREVVAEWLQKTLVFHPEAWQEIQNRLNRLGIIVAPSNRQQAYFPEGAQILPNPEGTAAGFLCHFSVQGIQKGQVWVLPGPPREVASIWDQSVVDLKKQVEHSRALKLLTWSCIGKSEAELGEWTEVIFAGSGLQIGYRAHRPYVEIKVWCPTDQLEAKKSLFQALEQKIKPWLIVQQDEDLAENFLNKIQQCDLSQLHLIDAATLGVVGERLGTLLRKTESRMKTEIHYHAEWSELTDPEAWIREVLGRKDLPPVILVLAGWVENGLAYIGFKQGERIILESFQSSWTQRALMDRSRRELTEIALKKWTNWFHYQSHSNGEIKSYDKLF